MRKKILVTGGAGYIGSHTIKELRAKKYEVVAFDNLEYGHRASVDCPLIIGDLRDRDDVKGVFKKHKFDGCIHFAAYTQAGESMREPAKYFKNNVLGGINLLEAMVEFGVDYLVFSSSCAVYGYPKKLPVNEEADKAPVSVYGETKLMFEKILAWYDKIFGIKSISLRYFNAAGISLDGKVGEHHKPETHIIPLAIYTALGRREKFTIFGDDYDTPDGTNIRDYIHVVDLALAHINALEYLFLKGKSDCFNAGTGFGYSNKEVINMVKKVTGVDFKVEIGKRRIGDPDAVYADNKKIKKVLGWKPKYSDLETIVRTAWNWYKDHPEGYED